MDAIHFKNICTTRDPVKWMERYAQDWENIFANHRSSKEQVLEAWYIELPLISTKEWTSDSYNNLGGPPKGTYCMIQFIQHAWNNRTIEMINTWVVAGNKVGVW